MTENIAIRKFQPADAVSVAAIYNASIDVGDATLDEVHQAPEDVLAMVENFYDREIVLILEREGEVIGFGLIKRYSDRPGYHKACETGVYLARDEVGKGYGPQLKKAIIEQAREFDYHHLVAKIFADNTRSIEYNRKLGYEVVGIQKEIGIKDGKWVDVAIMQLLL